MKGPSLQQVIQEHALTPEEIGVIIEVCQQAGITEITSQTSSGVVCTLKYSKEKGIYGGITIAVGAEHDFDVLAEDIVTVFTGIRLRIMGEGNLEFA